MRSRLSVSELFGLAPYRQAAHQALMVFRGDPNVPPSRVDTTSLAILTPRLSVGTWLGKKMNGRLIPVLNLVNHVPTPIEAGWSVRVSQVRDFRGRSLTYDSHNGTDFVIPPGTSTTAAASGRVISIRREFNRGGLKIYLDHGEGLMTTYNHLARALVHVGDLVAEGQAIALTGYSGFDGLSTFPWVAPHIHWNTILGGVLIDPFAVEGEVSLWRSHNDPRPVGYNGASRPTQDYHVPTCFRHGGVENLLADLKDEERRTQFAGLEGWRRGFELLVESTVYPTRFKTPFAGSLLFETSPPRQSRLSLPFGLADFDGIAFADDLGFRSCS